MMLTLDQSHATHKDWIFNNNDKKTSFSVQQIILRWTNNSLNEADSK